MGDRVSANLRSLARAPFGFLLTKTLMMAGKQLELSKSELLQRLDRRSRSHYGGPFPESLFDDLQKDALIPALERSANAGLAPTYFATWRHFRRALQLQRLRWLGIAGRDALRVQLFVRGYGLKAFEVRDALRSEFLIIISKLRPMLRSSYFWNTRDAGPSHFAVMERQLGPLDSRFEVAGLRQPTGFVLELTRIGFGAASRSKLEALEGWLLAGLDNHPLPGLVEEAFKTSDADYVFVRDVLSELHAVMFRPMLGSNFIDSPIWPTVTLVTILVARHLEKSSAGGFTVADIVARIPCPEGFERLATEIESVLRHRLMAEPKKAE